jgi:hypothetical protein
MYPRLHIHDMLEFNGGCPDMVVKGVRVKMVDSPRKGQFNSAGRIAYEYALDLTWNSMRKTAQYLEEKGYKPFTAHFIRALSTYMADGGFELVSSNLKTAEDV